MQQERGDANPVGAKDLADATARPTADAEDIVALGDARGKDVDVGVGQAAESLQRANAELLLDACDSRGQMLVTGPPGSTARRYRSAKA